MKFRSGTATCFFLFLFISTVAQVNDTAASKIPSTIPKGILKIVLESDSSTKSVLVSNIKADKTGDMSPVIGAANWMDNGKELLCRSLLEFDFNLLPVEILNNPLLILKADLVLYPINTEFAVNDNAKTSALYIRQVLDKWEDSSAMWNNQPTASFENQKSATIKTKNKNIPASIDVTEIVFNSIFKEKNNGFMIVYDDTHKKSFAAGQLFASPKNENPAIRPQLVIYIEYQKDKVFANKASSITPTKPVGNLLNDLYRKRNGGGSYPSYEQDRFSTNSVYQINLRTGAVPSNPAPTKKIDQ